MEIKAFEKLLKRKGISHGRLADLCKMDLSVFQSRMSGETEFTLGEIEIIVNSLSMDANEVMFIFFGS